MYAQAVWWRICIHWLPGLRIQINKSLARKFILCPNFNFPWSIHDHRCIVSCGILRQTADDERNGSIRNQDDIREADFRHTGTHSQIYVQFEYQFCRRLILTRPLTKYGIDLKIYYEQTFKFSSINDSY